MEDVIEWQPTMFQPVGGMDRIPYAFASRLDSVIRYGAVVNRIRQSDSGVTVTYSDGAGVDQTLNADYCICAMPLTIARTLDADFSAPIRAILDSVQYDSPTKLRGRRRASGRRKRTSMAVSRICSRLSTWCGIPVRGSSHRLASSSAAIPSSSRPPSARSPICSQSQNSPFEPSRQWIRLRLASLDAGQARRLAAID